MSENLKKDTTKGVFWSLIERFGTQGVQFLVMLVMARLLSPNDYGVVGLLVVFVSIAQAFVDGGFSQALIRKKDRTEIDNSTVFYFNIVVSVVIYLIFYLFAPYVSVFYNMPTLTPFMRVICLSIIINAFGVVQRALFNANIDFKAQAKASLIAIVISGAIGISLALRGFGPWALVWQQLSNLIVNTLFLWIYSEWRPLLAYSWKSFKELFSFGSKLLATSLLNAIYNNIQTIVIGKLYSAKSLGLYSRAAHFADLPSQQFTSVFMRVTFPVLCKVQDDVERLTSVYRRMLRVSAYIVFPLLIGMAAVAHPMIEVFIGKQWIECAYMLQIICLAEMWYPIHAINLDILQVSGRSDLFLKIEIYKKIVSLSLLALSAPFGIIAMCYSNLLSSLICLYINTYYSSKILGISLLSQLKDLFPTISLAIVMFAIVQIIIFFISNVFAQLIVGIIVGVVVYVSLSYILRFQEFNELVSLRKKRNN